jgi:FAD dependent oxidoreductase TIGR03364
LKSYDLLVIGGGILGTFHAYHALRRGLSVALLERHSRPRGATVRNFGQIVPSGMNTKWQHFGRRSLAIYGELQNKADISVRRNGSIYFASDAEELQLLEELYTINRANGYASELLTAEACCNRYPALRMSYCQGGLFFPEELTVEPRIAVHRILQLLVADYGLDYRPGTLARAIERANDTCAVYDQNAKRYVAGRVIICCGSELQQLFPEVFATADLEISQLQMMQTNAQPDLQLPGAVLTGWSIRRYESFRECPSYAEIKAKEDATSFQRRWGVHILVKQAIDGSLIVGDSHQYADRADELPYDTIPEVNEFMLRELGRIFNLPSFRLNRTWLGRYAQGKSCDVFTHTIDDRIHIVTGIGGKGMTAGPAFAEHHLTTLLA